MAKFCSNCGAALNEGAKFCHECGGPIPGSTTPQTPPPVQPYAGEAPAGNRAVEPNLPAPGFSGRVNDPQILAAIKKSKKAAGIFAFFLIPLPLIGFVIYSLFSEEMETNQALGYGAAVSLVFLVFALYGFLKERAKNTYEATVIDKKTRRAYRQNSSNDSYDTEYITVVRTTQGKKKKIIERENSQIWAWEYLQIGDRFKYHPQFHFPYELFDKSKAPYLACVSCTTKNSVEADRCQKCGLPLLK